MGNQGTPGVDAPSADWRNYGVMISPRSITGDNVIIII